MHPEVWEQLGYPGFLRDSFYNSQKYGRYFMRGNQYKVLQDAVLNRMVFFARMVSALATIGVLITIVFAYATQHSSQ